jgi:phage terminase large subunit GpA-like protein
MPTPTVKAILGRAASMLLPPPKLTVSEWADQNRIMDSSSPEPGPWRTERTPYLRAIMNALADYERVVFVKSAQCGGTEALLNFIGYLTCHAEGATLLVQPSIEMAQRFSKQRLAAMIETTPALRGRFKPARSRDSGNTMLMKEFTGGCLIITGANSPVGLRSLPAKYLLADEVDAFPPSAGEEGDPFLLAVKRTTAFGSQRRILAVSTPTVEGMSRITDLYAESDQRRFYLPCVECGFFQVLEWEQLWWKPGEPDTARYGCVSCGAGLENHHKHEMLPRGEWRRGAAGDGRTAGFHISALYSPVGWPSWSDLVREFEEARKQPETHRVFVNTVLGKAWREEQSAMPQAEVLAARCEVYAAEVPQAVALLTAGCDVQSDRIEIEVVGWSRGYESFSLRYDVLYGDPTQPHLWQRLDLLLSREFKHESGMPARIACTCIDCGYLTDEVLSFTRDKFARKVYAVKGLSFGFSKPVWPRKPIYSRKKQMLFLISSDEAKRWFHQRLRIPEPGSGYCHFPVGRGLDYFRGLLSETLLTRYRGGRPHLEWANLKRERNEPLDARCYAIAALFSLMMQGLNLDAYAENWERMVGPGSAAIAAQLPAQPAPMNGPPAPGGPVVYRSKFVHG